MFNKLVGNNLFRGSPRPVMQQCLLGYQSRNTSESIRIFALVHRSHIAVLKRKKILLLSLFCRQASQADRSNPSSFVVAQTRERYESIF
jgi:hypothetical protein